MTAALWKTDGEYLDATDARKKRLKDEGVHEGWKHGRTQEES